MLAMPVAAVSNDLVQMDLKKVSEDSVDVTLFTSSQLNDNVLVRKKSDNKYVILVPKVQSSKFNNTGLNNVKDLISEVDVKNIDDTTGGYTKVTLITTKPLNIKTRTQKSAPVTKEQEEYSSLIAQAKTIKNNIETTTKNTTSQQPKPAVNVVKKDEKPVIEKNLAKIVPSLPTKQETSWKIKSAAEQKTVSSQDDSEKIQKQNRKEYLQRLVSEAKEESGIIENNTLKQSLQTTEDEIKVVEPESVNETITEETSVKPSLKQRIKSAIPSKKRMLLILPFVILISLLRRKNNEEPTPYRQPLAENTKSDEYNPIADNKELSWQEKYKLYTGAKPVSRGENKGNYTFIKDISATEELEAKRAKLEEMLQNSSNIDDLDNINSVKSEDEVIHKAIKFKAFDNNKSLNIAKRNTKSRFKKYEEIIPLKRQETVSLGGSALHSNPRNLKDANLKVSDIDSKRIKTTDYIMSSVDEYFSILDNEAKQAALSSSLNNNDNVSNPLNEITKQESNLIVKSKFDIDKNKSLYIVNKDGKNSLVGKVKDEVFVLKNFDYNVTSPIQVRHDNDNVYMVKADKFKSLVEVNEDKMGVLIEL